MATTNPYALTDYESFWDDGYKEGLNSRGGVVRQTPRGDPRRCPGQVEGRVEGR